MALNTLTGNHLTPLGLKGLIKWPRLQDLVAVDDARSCVKDSSELRERSMNCMNEKRTNSIIA